VARSRSRAPTARRGCGGRATDGRSPQRRGEERPSIGLVNAEKSSAIATTTATSAPTSPSAAAWAGRSTRRQPRDGDEPIPITRDLQHSVSSSPRYLPSRNSLREIGLLKIVKMVRRSTSRWTRPIPTKIAIATANTRIAASRRLGGCVRSRHRRASNQHARADQRQRKEKQRIEHAVADRSRTVFVAIARMRSSEFIAWLPARRCEEEILERGAAWRHRDDVRSPRGTPHRLRRPPACAAAAPRCGRRRRVRRSRSGLERLQNAGETPFSTISAPRSSSPSTACGSPS